MLVSQYEMFKMEERQLIKDFMQRFTTLTNQIMLLGRTFDNVDLVYKVLRSLTKEWQPKDGNANYTKTLWKP